MHGSKLEVSACRNRASGPALSLHEVLVAGLTHLCQTKPTGLDAISELANWLLRNNPNQPVVEIAEEEPEAPSLAAQIASQAGEQMNVTCVFGCTFPLCTCCWKQSVALLRLLY